MPQPGSVIGDVIETFKEQGGKAAKEIISAPVDIVKASFKQPIPNPSAERQQQIKAEEKAKLAKVRSGLSVLQESSAPAQEDRRVQQGAEKAERGQSNQNAAMNNQLSASMTVKKKPEPLVVQQKRQNKLHGAG